MIPLNNVSSTSASAATTTLASSLSPSSLESFETALSDAVTQTLQQFGINPNSVNISIAPNSATSTTSNSAASTPATTTDSSAATSTAPDLAGLGPFLGTSSAAATPSAATSTSSASTASQSAEAQPAANAQQSFDEAYWAQQPAAVQQLQYIEDPGQRTELAEQLASQGYSIDVPIMAWGWDPSTTTTLRETYGYTWVPSALQSPVESAPGINDPGTTPYDPNNPPAGSIAV